MIGERTQVEANPKVFWPLAIMGWAVLVYGVLGVLFDAARTKPARWVIWFLGAAIVHDLVVAPAVLAIGKMLARRAPRRARALLQAGLIVSALVVLTSIPVLLDFGRNPNDPSTLPNDYASGLVLVLAAVWTLVSIAALGRSKRARALGPRPGSSGKRG